jgi:hypothetical protein
LARFWRPRRSIPARGTELLQKEHYTGLLELNAMAADMFFDMQRLAEASNIIDKGIRLKEINDKYLDILYSSDFVEYSVAAHCLANSVKDLGIFDAYRRASRLSEVALNLSSSYFAQIKVPERFKDFKELHGRFLHRQDRGYVFWCLCHHAEAGLNDVEEWAESALERAGLPRRTELAARSLDELQQLIGGIPKSYLGERLAELLAYGRSVFEKHGLLRIRDIYEIYHFAEETEHLPIILLGDDTIMGGSDGWKTVKPGEVEPWCNDVWDFDSWSESFEDACFPKP